jgi:hypothetical protein
VLLTNIYFFYATKSGFIKDVSLYAGQAFFFEPAHEMQNIEIIMANAKISFFIFKII